ncbi:MAG TPA: LuxR C-terminal-related transcriptional regulator [Spongiibacteraceae bacterium]|nr:LuxR C-terminal-related transcriptional regulator [Spongiibacteraceae bacterium]
MDEKDYLSTVDLLTQSHSLEKRLQLVLENTRSFLKLDACSIHFVADNGNNFHIISDGEGIGLVQEETGRYFHTDQSQDYSENEVAALRCKKSNEDEVDCRSDAIFTHRLRVNSVAGADIKLQKNLEARFRLTRNHDQGEFSQTEIQLIEKVINSIRAMIGSAVDEQNQEIFNSSAKKLLKHLRIGMFILNGKLEVLEKSPLAEELLSKMRAYHCGEQLLAGRSRESQAKLDRTISELHGNSELLYKIVDVTAAERGEQYTLVMAKVVADGMPFSGSNFLVFIFSCSEEAFGSSALLSLWQISPAEKRVLTAIARYDNIKKVAIELKISPNTAKAQLKSVYKKLGVGSKMRLMKQLNVLRNIEALTGR